MWQSNTWTAIVVQGRTHPSLVSTTAMLFSAAQPIPAALTSLRRVEAPRGLAMPERSTFFWTSSLSLREQGSRAFFRALRCMAFVSAETKRPPAARARRSLLRRGSSDGKLRVLRALATGWAGDGGGGGGRFSGESSGGAKVMTSGSWGSGGRRGAAGEP
ncbi:hypothetical protein PVAP13_2KG452805 [Panicum virgatum]|uniref:Uncharacterized protein n=1 Tax=Panicum virgatum TaxID=38727 RepID=A0A8T0WJ12_PANVG|nr:hypothetical protein PVAP13_2KG452805 [Panicum virgatum]